MLPAVLLKYPRLFCSLTAVLVASLLVFTGISELVDLQVANFVHDTVGTRFKKSPDIVLVTIDDSSLINLRPEYGTWPWSRTVIAEFLKVCEQADAVGINFLLLQRKEDEDRLLANAIKAHGRVSLAGTFENEILGDTASISEEYLQKSLVGSGTENSVQDKSIKRIVTFLGPSPLLGSSAKKIGHSNLLPAKDKLIRNYSYLMPTDKGYFPSFATATLLASPRLNNFSQPWANYSRAPELLYYNEPFPRISIYDVLKNKDSRSLPDQFRGKLVLLGIEARSLVPPAAVPVGGEVSELEVHATALSNWLQQTWVMSLSSSRVFLLAIILGLFPVLMWRDSITVLLSYSSTLLIVYHLLWVLLFYFIPMRLPWMAPVLTFCVCVFYRSADRLIQESRMRKHLEERQRVKQLLTSTLVHDLNTPINNMIMLLETVVPEETVSPKAKRRLENAMQEGSRITQLLRTLIDMDRMESGRMQLVSTDVNWNKLVEQVIQSHAEAAREKQLKFVTQFESREMMVSGDRILLERILNYLFDSMIKYAEEKTEIAVDSKLMDDPVKSISLKIKAHGQPLTGADQEVIFDPFDHLKSSSQSKEHGGFGWGIAYCKLAISTHRGQLKCQSPVQEWSEGVCFEVLLPLSLSAAK